MGNGYQYWGKSSRERDCATYCFILYLTPASYNTKIECLTIYIFLHFHNIIKYVRVILVLTYLVQD